MPALTHNLRIEQGSTWSKGFRPKIGPKGATVAFLTTGWTAKAQVRDSYKSGVVLHEWSTALGNAGLSGDAVVLSVTPAQSTAWTWDAGYYDLEVTSPDGATTYRIAEGRVNVSREVTR